ncbi:hypothetical protein SELMODRAFT_8589, partial [Selaginella moellendorffii]
SFTMFVMVLVLISFFLAKASYFDVYFGPGCHNDMQHYSVCGCLNIHPSYHGGFKFVYEGQPIRTYNQPFCQDEVSTTISTIRQATTMYSCNQVFQFQSIFFQC